MKGNILNKRKKEKVHIVNKIKSNRQSQNQNQAMLQKDKTLNLKLYFLKVKVKNNLNTYNSFGLIKGVTSTDQETFPDT